MGRLEALVVSALGRSPYDEKVVEPEPSAEVSGVEVDGQQYDERGHPINLETRMRIRDHIRASNEVMQAAGIIEETSEIRARQIAHYEILKEQTEIGIKRLEVGRLLLVAGVWGVLGLKRRILFYKDYSSSGLLGIIRRERAQYSVPHLICFGLPSLMISQGVEWVDDVLRAVLELQDKGDSLSAEKPLESALSRTGKVILSTTLDVIFRYIMLHYWSYAVLQQLHLAPSDRLLPHIQSLIPFSPHSLIQLPPFPASLSLESVGTWSISLGAAVAPISVVYAYGTISTAVTSMLYRAVYRRLPRPIYHHNQPKSIEITQSHDIEAPVIDLQEQIQAETVNSNALSPVAGPAEAQNSPLASHSPTLQALEGHVNVPLVELVDDSSSDGEDHDMRSQTLITFDVEATEITSSTMGTWSAELRSANEAPLPTKETTYHVTALTMLPPLLAADRLSTMLSSIVLLPLETLMVRVLGCAYRLRAGLGTEDILNVVRQGFSWQRAINLVSVYSLQMVVVGVVWAAVVTGFSMASQESRTNVPLDEDVTIDVID